MISILIHIILNNILTMMTTTTTRYDMNTYHVVNIFPLNARLSRLGVFVVGWPVNPKSPYPRSSTKNTIKFGDSLLLLLPLLAVFSELVKSAIILGGKNKNRISKGNISIFTIIYFVSSQGWTCFYSCFCYCCCCR